MSLKTINRVTPECFVCDEKVAPGEKENLATVLTHRSRVGLPEKISQLIGEEFVVVVTEADVVCKRCTGLLNHYDKLDNELNMVKKSLVQLLKQKYNLPIEEPPLYNKVPADGVIKDYELQEDDKSAGGLDTFGADSERGALSSATSNSLSSLASSPLQARKRPAMRNVRDTPPSKMRPGGTAANVDPNANKMKIYKCGFCSFQSKELTNVRLHMKIHLKTKPDEDSVDAQRSVTAAGTQNTVKKRFFRCQVCAQSFEDKVKCLEHIGREHTGGKKTLAPKPPPSRDERTKSLPVPQIPISNKNERPIAPKPSATKSLMNVVPPVLPSTAAVSVSSAATVSSSPGDQQQTQATTPSKSLVNPRDGSFVLESGGELAISSSNGATVSYRLPGQDEYNILEKFNSSAVGDESVAASNGSETGGTNQIAQSVTEATVSVNSVLLQQEAMEVDTPASLSDVAVISEMSVSSPKTGTKTTPSKNKNIPPIDIEAMIAALHNEGPEDDVAIDK